MDRIVDMFCHWLPPRYRQRAGTTGGDRVHMFARAAGIPLMCDLDARLRAIESIPGLQQVPSVVSPPIESFASGTEAADLARLANDEMADIVAKYPTHFPSFVASLPLEAPDAACNELHRAVTHLGAAGFQLFTNINGKPIDDSSRRQILQCAADLDVTVWLHPVRVASHADYQAESESLHELWWSLGWPHETSLAMARLVFAGVFDDMPNLRILTHHGGGTVPFVAGRFDVGLRSHGPRTDGKPSGAHGGIALPPMKALQSFWADTASFGNPATIACALDFFGPQRMVFATDMPFGTQDGWSHVSEAIDLVRSLVKDRDQQRAVLGGNAIDIHLRRKHGRAIPPLKTPQLDRASYLGSPTVEQASK